MRNRLPIVILFSFLSGVPAVAAETFECLVEPFLEVKVGSTIPGVLDTVMVDRGDVVKRDQVLARLKSDVAKANFNLVKARAEFAARKVERNEELYYKQMISIHEKDELETEAYLLGLEVLEVEERLKLRTIRSPIDGVVVKRHYHPGEYVKEVVILELAQVDPLRIEAVVPVEWFGRIRVGMETEVEWRDPPVGAFPARVTVVDPVVDAASGTIGVRLEVANPGHKLPAGAQCTVRFPSDDLAAAED